jgi:hypothetical protein
MVSITLHNLIIHSAIAVGEICCVNEVSNTFYGSSHCTESLLVQPRVTSVLLPVRPSPEWIAEKLLHSQK